MALREKDGLKNTQRKEIYTYEQEAEDLEKLEAELLKQLEVTQERETQVFGELKDALLDSSLPLKSRVSIGSFGENNVWIKKVNPITDANKTDRTNGDIISSNANRTIDDLRSNL